MEHSPQKLRAQGPVQGRVGAARAQWAQRGGSGRVGRGGAAAQRERGGATLSALDAERGESAAAAGAALAGSILWQRAPCSWEGERLLGVVTRRSGALRASGGLVGPGDGLACTLRKFYNLIFFPL